jgi:putative salt-induced outer membrane protein YdiY
MQEHRFQGWLAGAGLTYGYQFYLAPRWSLEASLGIGYAYLDYDKYYCEECGKVISRDNKNYFGLTQAGISLIYFIK